MEWPSSGVLGDGFKKWLDLNCWPWKMSFLWPGYHHASQTIALTMGLVGWLEPVVRTSHMQTFKASKNPSPWTPPKAAMWRILEFAWFLRAVVAGAVRRRPQTTRRRWGLCLSSYHWCQVICPTSGLEFFPVWYVNCHEKWDPFFWKGSKRCSKKMYGN